MQLCYMTYNFFCQQREIENNLDVDCLPNWLPSVYLLLFGVNWDLPWSFHPICGRLSRHRLPQLSMLCENCPLLFSQ